MHLVSLQRQGFIIKEKKPVKRRGSLFFVYSLSLEIRRKVTLTIKEPQTTIVSLNIPRIKIPLQV
jgi:hypothetical protein